MLMAAPYCREEVLLSVKGDLVSKPYVDMTVRVMECFGVHVDRNEHGGYSIPAPQRYQGCQYTIEPDASAASYFLASAAITGGRVRIEGLSMQALQGDVGFARVLESMGCTLTHAADWIEIEGRAAHGIDVDMNAMSDTVQTLAAVALFADSPTTVRGVAHNRHKETDRIGDLARELRRLGGRVEEREDGLTIFPKPLQPCRLETYRDHRMAMSLALITMCVPGCQILDPRCTEKTYPGFFEDLGRLIGQEPTYHYDA
jgi:3-phosphoshikimate 1-carboxyvinyltransferase